MNNKNAKNLITHNSIGYIYFIICYQINCKMRKIKNI